MTLRVLHSFAMTMVSIEVETERQWKKKKKKRKIEMMKKMMKRMMMMETNEEKALDVVLRHVLSALRAS